MLIRTKLYLLLGFMLAVLAVGSGINAWLVSQLVADSKADINDNYSSLLYVGEMNEALDELARTTLNFTPQDHALTRLDAALALQLDNQTEPGEATAGTALTRARKHLDSTLNRLSFDESVPQNNFASARQLNDALHELRQPLYAISHLNQSAIEKRNDRASASAEKVTKYSSLLALLALLVVVVVALRLPRLVTKPIDRLSESMHRIAAGEYSISIDENRTDEFAPAAVAFNNMAKRLRYFEQSKLGELMTEQARLQAVIDQFDEPILGVAQDDSIRFVNEIMAQLLGVDRARLLSEDSSLTLSNNALYKRLTAKLGEADQGVELRAVTPAGERRFVPTVIAVTATAAHTGKDIAYSDRLIRLRDVTDFVERDLRKTRFIATLSHELKTPVAAIEMCSDLVATPSVGSLNVEQQGYIVTIQENAERIRRMINEVLDLSKIETGNIDLRYTHVDPVELLDEAIETVAPFTTRAGIQIERHVQPNLAPINVDAHKVLWALNNFLTNAIRYSESPGRIRVNAFEREEMVYLEIQDFGPGLSETDQALVFQRYTRLRNDVGGTGLGLAISKEFVEALGGQIGLNSTLGSGATFWVAFPGVPNSNG